MFGDLDLPLKARVCQHQLIFLLYLARLAWNCLFTPIFGSFGGYDGVPFGIGYQHNGSKTRWSKKVL